MYILSIDIFPQICYSIIVRRAKRCDRWTGDEPDDLSSISSPRARPGEGGREYRKGKQEHHRRADRDMIRRPREAHITPPAAGPPEKNDKPPEGGKVDSMSIHEIEAKARELRQLQQLIEEAQAEAETIKDQIKAHMGEAEELRAGEYKIPGSR